MYENKYLELMYFAIIRLRYKFRETDKESHDLLNVIHNIPGLLDKNKPIDNNLILNELLDYEKKYLNWDNKYSKIIK